MVIKSQPTNLRSELAGAAQHQLDKAKAVAYDAMKDLKAQREAAGAKPGEGRVGGVHRLAMMAAIESEGPEVLTGAAEGWWNDQKRLNPWMCADGRVPNTDSPNGRKNRIGVAKEKWYKGQWYHWDAKENAYVPGEISARKGIA